MLFDGNNVHAIFTLQAEEFNDQPNGICLDCWEKTITFDQFYKSVQETHLILLNSKYKPLEIEKVEIKTEREDDLLSVEDSTVDASACDYTASDLDRDEDQNVNEQYDDNGKIKNFIYTNKIDSKY